MRLSFLIKVPIVAALIVLVDRLFPSSFAGARIGCLALAWLIAVAVARRDVRKSLLALRSDRADHGRADDALFR